MSRILTDHGEEYFIQNGLDSGTTAWSITLYDDASNGTTGETVSDSTDLPLSTEPDTSTAYARQSSTFSTADSDGDASALHDATQNDSSVSFDTSGVSGTVDSWALIINFQSTAETSASDHLVATGALSQEYDLSNVDTLDISAGGVGVSVD